MDGDTNQDFSGQEDMHKLACKGVLKENVVWRVKRKKNVPCEEGSWNKGTEIWKGRLDLLEGMKMMCGLFFFEDALITQNLKGWHWKVVVHISFILKRILILEFHKKM